MKSRTVWNWIGQQSVAKIRVFDFELKNFITILYLPVTNADHFNDLLWVYVENVNAKLPRTTTHNAAVELSKLRCVESSNGLKMYTVCASTKYSSASQTADCRDAFENPIQFKLTPPRTVSLATICHWMRMFLFFLQHKRMINIKMSLSSLDKSCCDDSNKQCNFIYPSIHRHK